MGRHFHGQEVTRTTPQPPRHALHSQLETDIVSKKPAPSAEAAKLRRRAEARLKARKPSPQPDPDTQRSLHELQVHQIELKLQNEELQQARTELKTALDEYTELYDFAPTGYLTLQPDGTISRANLTAANMLGMERSRLLNRRFALFLVPEDRAAFADLLTQAFATKIQAVSEVRLVMEGQDPRPVELRALVPAEGRECALLLADITPRKQAEEDLRASEARYRAVFEHSSVGVCLAAPDGRIFAANPEACRVLGRSEAEICGVGRTGIVDTSDPRFLAMLEERRRTNHYRGEMTFRHADGSPLPVAISITEFKDQNGEPRTLIIFHDISARKQAVEALRQSRDLLSFITEGTADAVFVKDLQGRYQLFNSAASRWVGKPATEVLGRDDTALFPPEEATKLMAEDRQALTTGVTRTFEQFITTTAGPMTVLTTKGPLRDGQGQCIGVFGVARDITALKRAEMTLRASETSLHRAQAIAHIGDWSYDFQSDVVSWSPEVYRIYGVTPETFEHTVNGLVKLTHPDDLPRQIQAHEAFLQGRAVETYQYRIIRPDGGVRVVEVISSEVERDDSGQPRRVSGTVQDITERKQAEAALRASEAKFHAIIEFSPVAMALNDEQGNITYLNRQFLATIGYTLAEIPTPEAWWFRAYPDSAYRQRVAQEWQAATEKAHREGTALDLVDYEVTCKDGSVRNIHFSVAPIGTSHVVVLHDITERKQAEATLRRSNRALLMVSKCDSELVRAKDETALLQGVCRIAIEDGGYRLAWVGYREEDEAKSVRPVASFGFEEGYLDTVKITWADTEHGRGPTGTVIRTGQRVVARNLPSAPNYEPWRKEATSRGYASSISLPLIAEGRTFGAWMIYASDPLAFDPAEELLLSELADNLAYGINSLRTLAGRKRTEVALHESEERFRSFFELSADLVCIADIAGRFREINPTFCKVLGYAKEELVSRPFLDFVHPEDREKTLQLITEKLERGETVLRFENRYVRKDGGLVWLEWTSQPDVTLGVMFAIARNITERKRAQTELAQKNHFLTLLNQIGQTLNRIAPPAEILERLSETVGQVLSHRNLYIALYDEVTNQVSFPIYWMDGKRREVVQGRTLNNGLTDYVIKTRAPILIPDRVSEVLAERGIELIGTPCQCYLAVPILIDARVIGVIAVQDYERSNIYDASHVELLTTFASQAAIAITNAHLYEAVEQELTDRKQAEAALRAALAEKTVLLKEIHHRVKNNLQVVTSLLNLQQNRTQDEQLLDTLASTRNRVRSMALIHEKLYQSHNLANLDLASYLTALCRQLHSSAGNVQNRVRMESAVTPLSLTIGLDQAVPCGLVINELVSNALKYAFPGERTGRIQVSLECPAPREVLLTVADDGVGLPAALNPGQTESLGLKLVSLLTDQLHGTITFERGSGTVVQVRFPNPSAPNP